MEVEHNVAQLLKSPIGATQHKSIEADIAVLDEDIELVGPVTGRVCLLRTDAGILVQGRVQAEVELPCSRCLAPFVFSLAAAVEEEFQASEVFASDNRASDAAEDTALLIDEHHVLDLGEVIRQQLLLALPIRPVCRSDCAGLCSQCGQNLNEGPCECTEKEDPRWSVLQRLRFSEESGEGVD